LSLTIKLEIYEGPLDLLLHLIKKNEVDIYDIPITLITDQYLEYLEIMESMNVELAGEFLLMAATLTQIKSKLLLPTLSDDSEEGAEEEDPRMAIVRPLLEHMKLKDAADSLQRRTILDRDVFARDIPLEDLGLEGESKEELVEANLFDLVDAFRTIVTRFEKSGGLRFVVETKTIQERIIEILRELKKSKQVDFVEICRTDRSKAELILSFLAVLELARVGWTKLFQNQTSKAIMLYFIEKPEFMDIEHMQAEWSLDMIENGTENGEETA
jgi:segregation and condensation protein A